ncbi:MAG: hypothetical protein IPK25_14860 [Saprospiraceae bacterium]|nr:hypothetical protein [Saprospiraceae bacterium]
MIGIFPTTVTSILIAITIIITIRIWITIVILIRIPNYSIRNIGVFKIGSNRIVLQSEPCSTGLSICCD